MRILIEFAWDLDWSSIDFGLTLDWLWLGLECGLKRIWTRFGLDWGFDMIDFGLEVIEDFFFHVFYFLFILYLEWIWIESRMYMHVFGIVFGMRLDYGCWRLNFIWPLIWFELNEMRNSNGFKLDLGLGCNRDSILVESVLQLDLS